MECGNIINFRLMKPLSLKGEVQKKRPQTAGIIFEITETHFMKWVSVKEVRITEERR